VLGGPLAAGAPAAAAPAADWAGLGRRGARQVRAVSAGPFLITKSDQPADK